MKNSTIIKRTLLLSFLTIAVVSYKTINTEDPCDKEGKIIGFNSLKCNCCWGWVITIGKDTIKTDNLPSEYITYRGNVKLKLGEKLDRCSGNYPYYKTECIEK